MSCQIFCSKSTAAGNKTLCTKVCSDKRRKFKTRSLWLLLSGLAGLYLIIGSTRPLLAIIGYLWLRHLFACRIHVALYSMRRHFIMVMAVKLALLFLFLHVAEPGVCPARTISMNVATTSDLQTLMTTINCTGEGAFNVTWIGRVSLVEAIEIRQEKKLTVTGSTSGLTDISTAVIDAGGATGMFTVYNGSTLSLNSLVLQGGSSTHGTAVHARLSSSVIVDDCVFTNNIATNGGETLWKEHNRGRGHQHKGRATLMPVFIIFMHPFLRNWGQHGMCWAPSGGTIECQRWQRISPTS